ncbi:hypothetical protein QQZ08_008360 [Neonectria magnoliae]|uniref:Zn(2)-C6 fungal-type domain-containing protein n=1 Tax=Neonectria magnoliae TaxID=2732573 RepID=A0ABR1HV58_9HYPO
MACKSCRSRKIKCDRTRPGCQNCRLRSVDCTYAGERRTKRWIQAGIDSRRFSIIRNPQDHHLDGTDARQGREIVVRQPTIATPNEAPPNKAPASSSTDPPAQHVDMAQSQPQWSRMESDPITCSFDQMACRFDQVPNDIGTAVLQTPTSSDVSEDESLLDRILDGDDMECTKDTNPALWMRASDGDEYTGPSSGISTISDLGLNWVRQNVADSQVLCETIQDIRNGVLNHLRQPKCIPQVLPLALAAPCNLKEAPDALLWRYVEAYFDTVQVIFPILDRDGFFSQLERFGTGQRMPQNPSWQALLSAVLASGCRAALSAETAEAFKESGREAWGYFHNALSFESRILHGSTDLMAVQAMAVMTVFAQGLSSPQRLEYTLCSIASRLAQSLALNRHPPPEWNLSEEEQRERNRVFWVIYCLDRSIALRCGRPAVMCDDDISCRFPRDVVFIQRGDTPRAATAKTSNVDFFLCFTKLSRICGKVSRMLYSASALYASSPRLLSTMNHLLQDLHSWLDLIPVAIRPGKPPKRMMETFGLSRDKIIVLHLSYYYVLCAIYRRFTPIFTQDSKNLQHLINHELHSSHIEAARSMVLLTKHLDIESFTPAWLVFYYPFTALTTIFVHIVSNPPDDRTQSDIALMETVVGFFGRLEYVTSGEAAFTKTTEFVRQARNVTDRYSRDRGRANQRSLSQAQNSSLPTEVAMPLQDCVDTTADSQMQASNSIQDRNRIPVSGAGNGQILQTTPPLTESLQDEENSDTQSTNRGMDNIHYDQSLYSDLTGLLAPPAGDAIPANWLGDWVLAV